MVKSFGINIQSLMKERNLTVKQLADALQLSNKSVQEWVGPSGRIPRNPVIIKNIAAYFKCSVHFLLFGEEDRYSSVVDILDRTEVHTDLYEITIKKVRRR